MWPEFIRKMTVLLLYDRLNPSVFTPKSWKPGIWYFIGNKNRNEHESQLEKTVLPFIEKPKDLPPNEPIQTPSNNYDQFGSHEYVIRSNQNESRLSLSDKMFKSDDEYDILVDDHFKPGKNFKKRKNKKLCHESFLTMKNRNFFNNENLNEPSSSFFGSDFHLPNLVSSSQFESNSSHNFSNKNKYLPNLNSERLNKNQKGLQINFKHQNELNILNKIIANY